MGHILKYTSHILRYTSHILRYTSHILRYTAHIPRYTGLILKYIFVTHFSEYAQYKWKVNKLFILLANKLTLNNISD